MTSNNLIYKDNKIIEASYKLSLTEQRVVLLAIGQVNSSEKLTENDVFVIEASDYSSMFSIDKKESFREMKEAIDSLRGRWVKVIDDGDNYKSIAWLSMIQSSISGQSIQIRFTKDIAPYLSQLEGSFTKYRIKNIRQMSSIYSIRIYELLMRWKDFKTVTLTVEQIRERLQLTSKGYSAFGNVKQKIIEPSINEITQLSDIDASYELIKKGKKVDSVRFSFQFKAGMEPKATQKKDALKAIKKIQSSLK